MIIIKLDGVTITSDDYEVNSISKTLTFDNKKAYSEEFTFYQKAFDIIKNKLIDAQNGRLASVKVQIYDNCCGEERLIINGSIKGNDYTYCEGDCFVKATVMENGRFLDCIRSLIVSHNMSEAGHPNVLGQKQYDKMERINTLNMIFIAIGFIPIALMVSALTFFLPKNKRQKLPDIAFLQRELQKLYDIYHYPSPYIRSYLDNICQQCSEAYGGTYEWQSSIFGQGGEHYNTVYFNAPSQQGERDRPSKIIQDNRPLDVADEFLNRIVEPFNAKWYVQNDVLKIERKDFALNAIKLDLTNENACYTPAEDLPPAYAKISYSEDNDKAGNEERGDYDYIKDWNPSKNDNQRGKKEYLFKFGRAKIGSYDDLFKSLGLASGFLSAISGQRQRQGLFLKLSHLVASFPKLLVLENGKLTNNSKMYGRNLYPKYFAIDNPNTTNHKAINFEIETTLSCDMVLYEGMPVILGKGEAIAETVTIDYTSRTVKLTGII